MNDQDWDLEEGKQWKRISQGSILTAAATYIDASGVKAAGLVPQGFRLDRKI